MEVDAVRGPSCRQLKLVEALSLLMGMAARTED